MNIKSLVFIGLLKYWINSVQVKNSTEREQRYENDGLELKQNKLKVLVLL